MAKWNVRYVHKISPSSKDTAGPVEIADSAFSDRNKLGAAFRKVRVLHAGESLSNFRIEGDKIVAFPRKSIWHSIILTPA